MPGEASESTEDLAADVAEEVALNHAAADGASS